MPRLSSNVEFRRRSLLILLWNDALQIYGLLPVHHQWELHEFYLPNHGLSPDEFELHAAGLRREKPSLVNKAGKHFKVLESVYLEVRRVNFGHPLAVSAALRPYLVTANPVVLPITPTLGKSRWVLVVPIARPEPNVRQLARAFLAVADSINREQNGDMPASESAASSRRDAA